MTTVTESEVPRTPSTDLSRIRREAVRRRKPSTRSRFPRKPSEIRKPRGGTLIGS